MLSVTKIEYSKVQYFKKEVKDQVDLLLVDKHSTSFLQIDTIVLTGVTISLFHLMRAIARAHASTRATSLICVKNSTLHLGL